MLSALNCLIDDDKLFDSLLSLGINSREWRSRGMGPKTELVGLFVWNGAPVISPSRVCVPERAISDNAFTGELEHLFS